MVVDVVGRVVVGDDAAGGCADGMDVAGAFEDWFDVAGWQGVFVCAVAQDGLFPQAEVDAVGIGAGFGWQCGFGAIEGRLDAVAGHGAGLQSARDEPGAAVFVDLQGGDGVSIDRAKLQGIAVDGGRQCEADDGFGAGDGAGIDGEDRK